MQTTFEIETTDPRDVRDALRMLEALAPKQGVTNREAPQQVAPAPRVEQAEAKVEAKVEAATAPKAPPKAPPKTAAKAQPKTTAKAPKAAPKTQSKTPVVTITEARRGAMAKAKEIEAVHPGRGNEAVSAVIAGFGARVFQELDEGKMGDVHAAIQAIDPNNLSFED